MTPQEALQSARDLFGPGTHIQVEITYGRTDLGAENHVYWVFAGNMALACSCGDSWEEAIEAMLSKHVVKEIALKGILGGAQ